MKRSHLSMEDRKLYRLFLMAENLEKKLSWILSCEKGLERMVEFFKEIIPLEEYYYSFESFYVCSEKRKKLLNGLRDFIFCVNHSDQEWNRTKKGETPTEDSIFIYVCSFTEFSYEEVNLNVCTQSVKKCLDKNRFIKESFLGQREKEVDALNEISLIFLRYHYDILRESIKDFRENKPKKKWYHF